MMFQVIIASNIFFIQFQTFCIAVVSDSCTLELELEFQNIPHFLSFCITLVDTFFSPFFSCRCYYAVFCRHVWIENKMFGANKRDRSVTYENKITIQQLHGIMKGIFRGEREREREKKNEPQRPRKVKYDWTFCHSACCVSTLFEQYFFSSFLIYMECAPSVTCWATATAKTYTHKHIRFSYFFFFIRFRSNTRFLFLVRRLLLFSGARCCGILVLRIVWTRVSLEMYTTNLYT